MATFQSIRSASVTPALTGAYATNDLLGTKLTLSSLLGSTFTGEIISMTLVDLAVQSQATDVVFFSSNPSGTTFTDNSALTMADADMAKILGVVSFPAASYAAFADNSVCTVRSVGLILTSDSADVYCCLIARGAGPTYVSASDLKLTVRVRAESPF